MILIGLCILVLVLMFSGVVNATRSRRSKCKNSVERFCYVCGRHVPIRKRVINASSSRFKLAYSLYFNIQVKNLDKNYVPSNVCNTCYSHLLNWLNGIKNASFKIMIPMTWREPRDHTECYFCLTEVSAFAVKYPSICPSVSSLVLRRDEPQPDCPINEKVKGEEPEDNSQFDFFMSTEEESETENNSESDYSPESNDNSNPLFIDQGMLDDLTRDLGLSISKSLILGSRLKQWGLLKSKVTFNQYRNRSKQFSVYYQMDSTKQWCFTSNIPGLFSALGLEYDPNSWRLFIDSGKNSLKAVLVHIGNRVRSIPIAYARGMPESYDTIAKLLNLIKYKEHQWLVCADLKVVAFLRGLQTGYTKRMCFLCLFDTRDDANHWTGCSWESRNASNSRIGQNNVLQKALVPIEKILLPPLHIKLGLMKNWVKALNTNGRAFQYLKKVFGKVLTEQKIKAGVFVGPQIRKLMKDDKFVGTMTAVQKRAWRAFVAVCDNFLGNYRSPDSEEIVKEMLESFRLMGVRMSLKIHFLFHHLDFFPTGSLGDVSDEHGERFHQEINFLESRYSGNFGPSFMGDYLWLRLNRATDPNSYKRKNGEDTLFWQ